MEINTTQKMEGILLSWTAPTRQAHEHTLRWYINASIAAGLMFIYSFFTGAWSFALVLAIAIAVYIFIHKEEPQPKTIEISEKGVTYAGEFTPWMDLLSFWVLALPNLTELHISHKRRRKWEIVISTGTQDIVALRSVLNRFLTEQTDKHEKLFDKISRICKL